MPTEVSSLDCLFHSGTRSDKLSHLYKCKEISKEEIGVNGNWCKHFLKFSALCFQWMDRLSDSLIKCLKLIQIIVRPQTDLWISHWNSGHNHL